MATLQLRQRTILVIGCLLVMVDQSSTTHLSGIRKQNRFTRTNGGQPDSVNETQVTPALTYVGEPPTNPNVTYGACEGRCSNHKHCQEGLFCIQRVPDDHIISTCLPPETPNQNNSNSSVVSNTLRLLNYCAEVPENELVSLTMQNTSEVSITTACSGGCMVDSDCEGEHLKCSQTSQTSISGCSGFKNPLVNYCYFDNSTNTTIANSTNVDSNTGNETLPPPTSSDGAPVLQYVGEPPFPSSLLECQGDCDSDWHCDFGLNCFKRSEATPIPGCGGVGGVDDIYSVDYCYTPPSGTLVIVQNPQNNKTSSTRAGKCEGNCTTDNDCTSGLKCFIRQHYEAVPGCLGVGACATNYCYDPADEVFNSTGTASPFQSPIASPVSLTPIAPDSIPTSFPTQKSNIIVPPPTIPVQTLAPFLSPISPVTIPTAPTTPVSTPTTAPLQTPVPPVTAPTVPIIQVPTTAPFQAPVALVTIPTAFPTQKSNIIAPSPTMQTPIPTTTLSTRPSSFSSEIPSNTPSDIFSSTPSTVVSSFRPSENPSVALDALSSTPSENPTVSLSEKPSETPTLNQSEEPSGSPIILDSLAPSDTPSDDKTDTPTLFPTRIDGNVVVPETSAPSTTSSFGPSSVPSDEPTVTASAPPSSIPSSKLPDDFSSSVPSNLPSEISSMGPSIVPIDVPTTALSAVPSSFPSDVLSNSPSIDPSEAPSRAPISDGFIPDDDCLDINVQGRASSIYQRLMKAFQYNNSEIALSNETATSNSTVNRSYQQAAYDWVVFSDEQVACSNATNLIQRYALAVFWFACGGDYWSINEGNSFLAKTISECQWKGVTCDDTDSVIGLHLDESNITGILPGELASIVTMRVLNIDMNHLSGSIPTWFSQWKELEVIDMDHNNFTGTIPSSLYSLSTIRVLDLDSNALTGTISEVGLENWIDSLFFLQLDFNQFVGTIPQNLGKFPNLQYLSLFGNNFTNSILSSIENLCEGIVTIYANCELCQNSTCCTACLEN